MRFVLSFMLVVLGMNVSLAICPRVPIECHLTRIKEICEYQYTSNDRRRFGPSCEWKGTMDPSGRNIHICVPVEHPACPVLKTPWIPNIKAD